MQVGGLSMMAGLGRCGLGWPCTPALVCLHLGCSHSLPQPPLSIPQLPTGNVAPAALVVPPLDTSALPSIKAQQRVISPSALGKRSRVDGETPVSGRNSPSKLRGAFQRHQQRSARGEAPARD